MERSDLDRQRAPWSDVILGYGPMVPTLAGTAAAALAPQPLRATFVRLTVGWSSAVLCFVAGVRRGLSFAMPGGATAGEIASSVALFAPGVGAVLLPSAGARPVLPMLGYALLGLLDRRAAGRGEAPPYFARLRPRQAVLAATSLALLAVIASKRD